MAIGFCKAEKFRSLCGWELSEVSINKWHVVFRFNEGHALLDVADKLSFRASDGSVEFVYEINARGNKCINISRILFLSIVDVVVVSKDRLDLVFENGDVLSVFDNPNFCSWWFYGENNFVISDMEYDDLTAEEIKARLS